MIHSWEYEADLPGGRVYTIQVQPKGTDVDFDLYVYDEEGTLLAADTSPDAAAECTVTAEVGRRVMLRVELMKGESGFSVRTSSRPINQEQKAVVPPIAATANVLTAEEAGQLLAVHNAWREKYDVPPLVWSPELSRLAQEWAEQLKLEGMRMRHRSPNKYGENLYWSFGKRRTPQEVVDAWGNEKQFYDPAQNNWWPKAGHFSQLVWRSTERVGGGVVRAGDQEIWVCNYDPRGNWIGERPY